jgi:hypothetical protein fulcA4_02037
MDIEKELEKLNFSKLEAQIYLALIEANPLSAYQIAKKIEISRTSIYNALEHMLDKGVVLLIPNDTSLYIPQEPDIIFEKRYKETVEAIDNTKQSLKVYKENKRNNSYLVLKEFDSIVLKVKEILKKAKNEIYINADFNLDYFKDEFQILRKKGIRVVIFSFFSLKLDENIEFYSHNRVFPLVYKPRRLMVVVDDEISLIADSDINENWSSIISNNKLFIRILSEHIHNDIYLLKLKYRYGKEIYDNDLYINTEFEISQKIRETK